MEDLWENYMQNGKINPVSGIFLGKNNFGYQDKQEMVLTPNQPEADFSAKDIADRYSLPEATSEDWSTIPTFDFVSDFRLLRLLRLLHRFAPRYRPRGDVYWIFWNGGNGIFRKNAGNRGAKTCLFALKNG